MSNRVRGTFEFLVWIVMSITWTGFFVDHCCGVEVSPYVIGAALLAGVFVCILNALEGIERVYTPDKKEQK